MMALSDRLLKKLVCPKCQQSLTWIDKEDRLNCKQCRLSFRVASDIPVLLLDEAEPLD